MNLLKKAQLVITSPGMLTSYARWLIYPKITYKHRRIHGFTSFGAFYHADTIRPTDGEEIFIQRCRGKDLTAPVFDVGANLGLFTMAMCFGSGPVHSFEPVPSTFEALEKNCEGLNVVLNRIAISDQEGETTMIADPRAPAMSRFGLDGTIRVRTMTLDDYFAQNGILQTTLLKVDVEGAEPRVFRGAARLLREQRIAAIFFEFSPSNLANCGFNEGDLMNGITNYGYHVFELKENSDIGSEVYAPGKERVNLVALAPSYG